MEKDQAEASVLEYIKLRAINKENDERIAALETVILSDPDCRADKRIKIIAGRKTVSISDAGYESLEAIGESTEVVEKRRKKLDEFDIQIQRAILSNPDNYVEKVSKESIRIAEVK